MSQRSGGCSYSKNNYKSEKKGERAEERREKSFLTRVYIYWGKKIQVGAFNREKRKKST